MNDAAIYPYVLEPKLTTALWGGGELVAQYGKNGDPHAKLGESWECWDTNRVVNGALANHTVAQLRAELGARLLGDLDPLRIFPVLTKIITAHDWLSVQVHPGDAYARRVEKQPNGKTECWYVMEAAADAQLVVGWARDTSRAEYLRRVADGTLGEILRKVPVKAGDTVFIPAGLVHAIGSGITLFETQQASDLTYRMFDWNRVDANGQPRELHVQKAADVLDYGAARRATLAQVNYHFDGLDRTALVAAEQFVVERIVASEEPASLETSGRPIVLMALGGALEVTCGDVTAALHAYQTALIPAAAQWCTVRAPQGTTPFTYVTPERDRLSVAARMLAAGVDQAAIDGFMDQF